MKPWYWTASGVAAMVYLAWHGGYESAGWWAAAVVMGFFGLMTWLVEQQQKTIRDLLQIMREREDLGDEKVACIADMAGVGPSYRAHMAIAMARVQAKREKWLKHG